MERLKEFYAEAEKNEELKAALLEANKEMQGTTELETVQAKIIEIAKKFNYDLTEADFETECKLDTEDLENVAGGSGTSGGCLISNNGCTIFGEITEYGGCIILGIVYRED